jgi:integrase
MPQKSESTVHILEGKATLYKRQLSPLWYVRFKVQGRWVKASTKAEELKEAKSNAVELVTNAWFREKNELPIISKRFSQVANLAIKRMEDLEKIGEYKKTYKTYVQALNRYLIKFFKNHNVDRIDNALMQEFNRWRIQEMKRQPSKSVLNNHNSALNRVFDEAIERGYMTKLQVPLLKNYGKDSERRPDITIEDYTPLYRGMRKWVKTARKGNEKRLREVMREYVLVIANVGFRPGTEGMNLKWHNVYFYEQDDKKYLALWVEGKTDAHEMTARHSVVRYLDRLRLLNPEWQEGSFEEFLNRRLTDYVFRIDGKDMTTKFGRMFKRLLDNLGLLIDPRTGKERTLYSLRHMYATHVLTKHRMSIEELAEHMGTSVTMIQNHYNHIILRKAASRIAGDKGWRERLDQEK